MNDPDHAAVVRYNRSTAVTGARYGGVQEHLRSFGAIPGIGVFPSYSRHLSDGLDHFPALNNEPGVYHPRNARISKNKNLIRPRGVAEDYSRRRFQARRIDLDNRNIKIRMIVKEAKSEWSGRLGHPGQMICSR
jgi:hypothetical protein